MVSCHKSVREDALEQADCHTSDIGHWFAMTKVVAHSPFTCHSEERSDVGIRFFPICRPYGVGQILHHRI